MKTRLLLFPLAVGLLTLTAWTVHTPEVVLSTKPEAQVDAEDQVPEKYRATIARGLAYLAKQQHADGHWEGEGEGGQRPVAMTGLVGLALLMEKEGPQAKA